MYENEPMKGASKKDELEILQPCWRYSRTLIEDLQQWTNTGGDMAQLVEAFDEQLNKFTTLHPSFKDELLQCIQQESKHAAQEVWGQNC